MTTAQSNASLQASDHAIPFGWSYSIAVLAVALLNVVSGIVPSFEEWAEDTFSHAWLHVTIFGMVIFLVLGLIGIGQGQNVRRTAYLVVASTVIALIATVTAAALAGSRGSM